MRTPQALAFGSAAVWMAVSSASVTAQVSSTPSRDDLQKQLDGLRARLQTLEAAQESQTALTAEAVDRTVQQVLSDAEKRSQLLADAGGFTAGYDKGRFFIRSEDSNWVMMPSFVFQARYVFNDRTDGNVAGKSDGDINSGMQMRRMRLIFEGNACTPDLQYKFQWESRDTTGDMFLQDAWARYKFTNNFRVEVGQFKDAIHHEEAVADQNTLAADRSWVNAVLGGANIDRIQGIMFMYDNGSNLHVNFVVHDGANTKNTDFTESGGGTAFVGVGNMNQGYSLRAEYMVMGNWKEYDDFSAMGDTQDLLVIGGGANWSQGGSNSVFFHTVDLQYENTNGLSVYVAGMGFCREINTPTAGSGIPNGTFYDVGVLAQAGYMISPKVEVFGQYQWMYLDDETTAGAAERNRQAVGFGANYFMCAHKVKLTTDLTWLCQGSPINATSVGALSGTDGQLIFRVQAQLAL